jgi:hypothetical protein
MVVEPTVVVKVEPPEVSTETIAEVVMAELPPPDPPDPPVPVYFHVSQGPACVPEVNSLLLQYR